MRTSHPQRHGISSRTVHPPLIKVPRLYQGERKKGDICKREVLHDDAPLHHHVYLIIYFTKCQTAILMTFYHTMQR